MNLKFVKGIFCFFVILTLLTPFWVFRDLLFPYITSKAYYLRILVEISLPFYLYLVSSVKEYRPNFKNPLTISVVAFLVFNVISAVIGVNPLKSFWGNFERMGGVVYIAHLSLLYFYVLLLGQIGQQYIRRFIVSVILISGAVAMDGLIIKLTHNHFLMTDPSYPRISGTFGNPIFIASFLIIPMLLTIYYLLGEEKLWLKIFYGAIVILELYVILLSETRGAIVGLVIGLFISSIAFVAFNKVKKVRRWGGLGVLLFCILVGLAFTQHTKFQQGSMLYRVFNLKDTNTSARLVQWKVALKGFKDKPILGVGAENYYFISNKYYNPEIFKYDPSWFDKPHNYWIEVLVTNGVLGFAAYVLMSAAFVWILWRAYRTGLLTLLESCLLLTGFLAYGFQNLFVFDTIPASMMFFVILGFGGFLWHESRELPAEKKKNQNKLPMTFIVTVTGLSAVFMVYTIYVLNVTGLHVSKAVNYGYAYSSVNPDASLSYFKKSIDSPYDFDPIQTASKYSESVVNWVNNPQGKTESFVDQSLESAITAEQKAISRVPNDPTAWQQLANLYLAKSILNKTTVSSKAWEAAQTAMDLAPKRPEPEFLAARIKIAQNDITGAQKLLEGIVMNIPENNDAKIQLALLYNYTNQVDKAIKLGEEVLSSPTFHPNNVAQIDWMGPIYVKQNNLEAAANIYLLETKIDPNSANAYWNLAQIYVKLGKINDAKVILGNLIAAYPQQSDQFKRLLETLK